PTPHPLPLHDALPISPGPEQPQTVFETAAFDRRGLEMTMQSPTRATDVRGRGRSRLGCRGRRCRVRFDEALPPTGVAKRPAEPRSEEHTSELQSPDHL